MISWPTRPTRPTKPATLINLIADKSKLDNVTILDINFENR